MTTFDRAAKLPRRRRYDDRPGNYYVSVKDGSRFALLLGPFDSHRAALKAVYRVRAEASRVDPFAWFYSYGTCRADHGAADGVLNERLRFVRRVR